MSFRKDGFMKTLISILPILLTLSACGSGGDNTVGSPSTDVSQDEYEAQAEPKISAAADLPDDLQAAALAPGDMPCGLPRIPGELQSHKVDQYSHAFLSTRPFGEIAGFYKLAAEKAGHVASVATMTGTIEVKVAIPAGESCSVQAQDGGIHRTPEGEDRPATGVVITQMQT
jgi:hypothetical protein